MDIDITVSERKTLLFLINAFLPGTTVWAYGSRVKFTSKPESDLDLAAFINPGQEGDLAELKNAFAESELPFKVDVLDWNAIPENFQQNIHQKYVILQDANAEKNSMPQGWKTYKIEDIAELRKDIFSPKGEDWPYIGLEHIDQQSLRLNSIGNAKNIVSNKFHFLPGDILYGKLRPYFRKVFHANFEGVCSTDIFVIKNKNPIKNDFLFYLIATEEFTSLANSGSTGTHMPRADWAQIKKSNWAVPNSLTEQQSIASVLSSLDDKIELNRQMNQTLENIAQSIFTEWFVNFNFPGFDGELVNGLPKGWMIGKLGQFVEVKGGSTPSTANPDYWDGTFHWTTPKDLSNNLSFVLLDTERKITEAGVKQISSGILPKGTLLLSSRAPVGYLAISQIPISINQGYIAIQGKTVSNLFMLYWLKQNMESVKGMANGSTFQEISKSNFREIGIAVPNKQALDLFDGLITPIFDRIVFNEIEKKNLSVLRDSLLPRLMTGKIKVAI